MLFKADVLERIAKGEVDLAFRRWRRPSVTAGGRLRTPIGVLGIKAVDIVPDVPVAPADAARAGFSGVAELERSLGDRPGALYRIELGPLRDDERVALREADTLSDEDFRLIAARLTRWEGARSVDYGQRLVAAIAEGEGVPAATLAGRLCVEKDVLKRDVRALKEFGLTQSLSSGYRLTPRGVALRRRMIEERE